MRGCMSDVSPVTDLELTLVNVETLGVARGLGYRCPIKCLGLPPQVTEISLLLVQFIRKENRQDTTNVQLSNQVLQL